MKTTVEISDSLLHQARQMAAREGSSVRALIEEGLSKVLQEREARAGSFQMRRVTAVGEGIDPTFSQSWEAIREAIYEP